MASDKGQLIEKVNELNAIISALPDNEGKAALSYTAAKLQLMAQVGLDDRGNASAAIKALIPGRAMVPGGIADGDGHAITCC